jgi:hypothetical protein
MFVGCRLEQCRYLFDQIYRGIKIMANFILIVAAILGLVGAYIGWMLHKVIFPHTLSNLQKLTTSKFDIGLKYFSTKVISVAVGWFIVAMIVLKIFDKLGYDIKGNYFDPTNKTQQSKIISKVAEPVVTSVAPKQSSILGN